jgi:hypothetical protein
MATSKAPSLPLDPTRDDRIELYRQRFEDDLDIFTGEFRAVTSNEDSRRRTAHQKRKDISKEC